MKVSFCITCKGRTKYLKQVLPQGIADNKLAEFVLVDYSSDDGLEEWLRAEMWHHVERGQLVVYRVNDLAYFIHPHAKNLAHRLATGDILCNMDCDNIPGKDFDLYLQALFAEDPKIIARPQRGGGRMAMTREAFHAIGGYDEDMHFGWGQEDNDLYDRALRIVRGVIVPETFNWRVEHDNVERGKGTATADIMLSNKIHGVLSQRALLEGRVKANSYREWGYWPLIWKNYTTRLPAQ